jgi:hypothetical protein
MPAPPPPLSLSLSGFFGSAKEPEKPIISFEDMETQFLKEKRVYILLFLKNLYNLYYL